MNYFWNNLKTNNQMTKGEIKSKLILAGIKNLNEFGYEQVNAKNILTDDIYSQFFLSMLNDNLGNGKSIDEAINELRSEIKK